MQKEEVAMESESKITPNTAKTNTLIAKDIEALEAFIAYFQVQAEDLKAIKEDVFLSRLATYALQAGQNLRKEEIVLLQNKEIEPENFSIQRILNIRDIFDFLEKENPNPDVALLEKIHKKLLFKLPTTSKLGKLREPLLNLFTPEAKSQVDALWMQKQLPLIFLSALKSETYIKECLLLYDKLIKLSPFNEENECIAALFCHQYLRKKGFPFVDLVEFEKYVFFDNVFNESIANSTIEDEEQILLFGQPLFSNMMLQLRKWLIAEVKKKFQYYQLSHLQQNSISYWLEILFFKHYAKLQKLSKRQQEIINLVALGGNIANKDLTFIFKVDRKTIQRDFNELLEKGIVELRGEGRNLRYCLNYRMYLSS